MRQCAPEDSISQCPFLQMIDTAGVVEERGDARAVVRGHAGGGGNTIPVLFEIYNGEIHLSPSFWYTTAHGTFFLLFSLK